MANGDTLRDDQQTNVVPEEPTPIEPITQGGSLAPTEAPQLPTASPELDLTPEPTPTFDLGDGVQRTSEATPEQLAEIQAIPTSEPTPAPIPEPVIEEVATPEPTPTPSVVTTPSEGVTPTPAPTPVQKVESTQDIKSKELDNQAKEEAQITEQQQKTIDTFTQAITSGNLETARDLAMANPDLRDNFNSQVKSFLGNRANTQFFGKYAGMSNEQMLSEVENGSLVVGSEQYKLLPPDQRQSFEQFKATNDAGFLPEKTSFVVDNTETLSLEGLVSQMKGLFTSDLRTKYSEILNSDEINNEAKGLEKLQNDISDVDAELERLEDEVREEFPRLPVSQQNAIINDRKKNILRNKNTLVNQYSAKLGTYRTLKDNAQTELDFFKFEDSQNREVYKTALGLYETRRKEMREDEKVKFLEENKKLASERQLSNQKELAEFNASLREDNLSGGKYVDDGKGNLAYIKDGKQVSILSGLGENVGESQDDEYSYKTYQNDDGTFTTFGYPKKGQNVFQQNYGADGEPSEGWLSGLLKGQAPTSYGGPHDGFTGLDVDGAVGDPVSTPLSGKVLEVEKHSLYGNTMLVQLDDGNKIRFSHLQDGYFNVGDDLAKGAVIGTIGNTGNVLDINGNVPTASQRAEGVGSHLDIVTIDAEGRTRGAKETESYLNNIGSKEVSDTLTERQQIFFNQQVSKFKSDPQVKAFESALVSGADLLISLNSESGPGDVAGVFGFMKTLDPASVVRESEFEVAAASAGITSKPELLFKKVSTGELLTNIQRKEFGRLAFEFVKNKGKLYDTKYDDMSRVLGNAAIGGSNLPTRTTDFIDEFNINDVEKITNGVTITTPGGFQYSTSGSKKAQDDFF